MSADIAAHYAAVMALLPSGLKAYKGVVPDNPTYPYVVIWGDTGREDSEALSDDPSTLTLKVYATCAGLSFDAVAISLKLVRAALNRARPVVAGRVTYRMVQAPQQPIQADLGISIAGIGHPFYAVDQYDLTSDPA
jgi:hypothetical protein